ncbi:MAG: FAD-binding oxidoreductase, partial [bacterium]
EAGLAVVPWGGGTGRGAGYPPERYDVALSTENLSAAVDFLRDDLTAVVGAGMTIDTLDRLTSPEGQSAGLDPPCPHMATVGGTIMAERSGPMRIRYGRARDRVMRMRVALADGSTQTYGALVVKNVTGYDMNRLLAGSWGSLAVATELAIRLYKKPERTGARAVGFRTAQAAFSAARRLMAAPLSPMWMEVLDSGRLHSLPQIQRDLFLPGSWCLAAAYGDFEEGLEAQLKSAEELVFNAGGRDVRRLNGPESEDLGRALADTPGGDFGREDALKFRASGRMDQLPLFAEAARNAAAAGKYRLARAAHAASGVFHCWLAPEGSGSSPRAAWETFSAECRAGADRERGRSVYVRLDAGPLSIRSEVAVWGEDGLEPAAIELMRRLKAEFDPKNTLSPGRFIARI